MTKEEALYDLRFQEFVRFKEIESSLLYDAMYLGEDTVMVRLASPETTDIYMMHIDLFCDKFDEYGGPQ